MNLLALGLFGLSIDDANMRPEHRFRHPAPDPAKTSKSHISTRIFADMGDINHLSGDQVIRKDGSLPVLGARTRGPKPGGNRGSSGWMRPGTPIGVDAVPGPTSPN